MPPFNPGVSSHDSKWFGGGYIFGTQVIAPGTLVPPSILLPSQFATIQEASVDFTLNVKELRGIFEDPEDVANASRKVTGKIVTGRVSTDQLNKLVFGELGGSNFFTGTKKLSVDEGASGTGAFVVPYTIPNTAIPTLTVANGATFFEDKGVRYFGTRYQLQPVPSAPAQGQYTYNPVTGVYTFAAADSGQQVLISYVYTSTAGHTLQVDNLVMGSTVRPVFECLLQNPNEGDNEILFFNCKATKIMFPIKQEDYVKLEIDFQAYADAQGRLCQFLTTF